MFKTIQDLAYKLREIVYLHPNQIAKALSDEGFILEFIRNKPYWAMNEKKLQKNRTKCFYLLFYLYICGL